MDQEVSNVVPSIDSVTGEASKVEEAKPKRREKRPKKRAKTVDDRTSSEEKTSRLLAAAYLKTWKRNNEQWKFQKVRQTWLLRNMYDEQKLSDKHFKVMLKYLVKLNGGALAKTIDQSKQIIEQSADDAATAVSSKRDRARRILELFP